MINDFLLAVVILFLLPIFPFSMGTNFLLSKLRGNFFLIALMAIFMLGTFLLELLSSKDLIFYIPILGLFSAILYAIRILSASTAYVYSIYYYTILSGFAWLWKSIGGDMTQFLVVMILPVLVLGILVIFLDNNHGNVHYKMLRGLGKEMPRFSIMLIITILLLIMTPYFSGFNLFLFNVSDFSIFYLVGMIIVWILLTWSGIRFIEKFIYGVAIRKLRYKDISILGTFLLGSLLLVSVVAGFIFVGVI